MKIFSILSGVFSAIQYIKPGKLLTFILTIFQRYRLNLESSHSQLSQLPNCFPNDNTKRIDYVIVYKKDQQNQSEKKSKPDAESGEENEEKDEKDEVASKEKEKKERKFRKKTRKLFIKQLKEEGFDVERLQWVGDECEVFILLHCSLKRLFEEAENTKLQMRLNNVKIFYNRFIN